MIDQRPFPELLDDDERKALLSRAFEQLWAEGGQLRRIFERINRPFYIVSEFRRVLEEFGHRDTGLDWSKNQLDAHPDVSTVPLAPYPLAAGALFKMTDALRRRRF
jgi:hypothetical protein